MSITSAEIAVADLLAGFTSYARAVLGVSTKTTRNHRIYLVAYLRWWQLARPNNSGRRRRRR